MSTITEHLHHFGLVHDKSTSAGSTVNIAKCQFCKLENKSLGHIISDEVDAKTKESTRKTEENWMKGIKKAMNERNLNEGQWKDRKQWSLGVGQRRKNF